MWAVGGNGELWDKQANKCLNDPGGKSANGTPIVAWTCNDGAAQMIVMYPAATVDGDYVNTLRVAGKCLAASNGGTAGGTRIVLYACNGSGAEKWRIVYNYGSGQSTTYALWDFENPQSGRCLLDPGESTRSGTQLRLGQCDSSMTSNADWSQSR